VSTDEKIEQVCDGLNGAEEIKQILHNDSDPIDLRVASATAILDELANDPNIPLHGRTLIWNIMSRLEELA